MFIWAYHLKIIKQDASHYLLKYIYVFKYYTILNNILLVTQPPSSGKKQSV